MRPEKEVVRWIVQTKLLPNSLTRPLNLIVSDVMRVFFQERFQREYSNGQVLHPQGHCRVDVVIRHPGRLSRPSQADLRRLPATRDDPSRQ